MYFILWIVVHHTEKSGQGPKNRNWLMHRPWRSAAYWCTPHDLLSRLSYGNWYYQLRDGITQSDMYTPTSIIKEENAPQSCTQANLEGVSPQLMLLLLR